MVRVWMAWTKQTVNFRIAATTLVRDIMELLERRTGLALYDQRLICGGRELNPESTLDQLNVKTKETLYLFQRQQNICASWAASGNCKDRRCAHTDSHTVANSPRYVQYSHAGSPHQGVLPELITAKDPQPIRKHALEIRCPRAHELAEQLVVSPVPALVAEMRLGDWEPEATFVQRVPRAHGTKAWPELAQIPSDSWEFFSSERRAEKDAASLEFDASSRALLMNTSNKMPLDSETLKQQASSWESTEEAREQAYSAWVASQSQRFQCAVEAS